ncbi:hypothetical protein PHLGIDRAFT_329190 [Phlebiopsis gigantea 11061_1 CR5-6]|uniref:Uncharacterized protein n=1 Tax=Phlebiopsis gigantea (strain 11061_1 CR5-6) TaxID=745531 RepID=A0A0C3P322_PHLG1|nr:hypothetical protein PHLGIDRAFT_329190 [Phlebiopsis gigantea 11061_1 CR5-6]
MASIPGQVEYETHVLDSRTGITVTAYEFMCTCNSRAAKFEWDRYSVETVKTYDVSPALFLSRAFGDDGDPLSIDFLHVLATMISCYSDCRTVGLLDGFLSLMTKVYSFEAWHVDPLVPTCYWELPLMGIINMVTAIKLQNGAGREDNAILQKIWDSRSRILEIVWRDFAKLLPVGAHGDHIRLTVMQAFMALTRPARSFGPSSATTLQA